MIWDCCTPKTTKKRGRLKREKPLSLPFIFWMIFGFRNLIETQVTDKMSAATPQIRVSK